MEAPRKPTTYKLGLAGSFYSLSGSPATGLRRWGDYSLALVHVFTHSLLHCFFLFTVHCSLSTVFQITFARNSLLFGV